MKTIKGGQPNSAHRMPETAPAQDSTGVYATDLCELAEPVAVKHGFWQEHNSKG